MKSIVKFLPLACIALCFLGAQSTEINRNHIAEVTAFYKARYLASAIDEMPFNGNLDKCKEGILPDYIYQKALMRVNFFREMQGLKPVVMNYNMNINCQKAALMTKSNGTLSHTPPKTWKCFSDEGYTGANKSNLGFMDFKHFKNTAFITHYMQDFGASNAEVGHRKWIQSSMLTEISYGATNTTDALMVTNNLDYSEKDLDIEFMAYPWSGFMPVDLIFPKWSFSLPAGKKVSFHNTKVTIKVAGKGKVELKILSKTAKPYTDPTIVWVPTELFSPNQIKYSKYDLSSVLDKEITVSISRVLVDGKPRDFNYTVTPFVVE